MIQLNICNFSAYTLEKLWLVGWLCGSWSNSTSGLLDRIPVNELHHISIHINFELILCQALLANAVPEARNILWSHLLVRLKWLIEFSELNKESVVCQFLCGSRAVMLRHDLHGYCVLTRNDLSVWTHHVILNISGFYLQWQFQNLALISIRLLTLNKIALWDLLMSVIFAYAFIGSIGPVVDFSFSLSSSLSWNFTSLGGLNVTFLVQSSYGTAVYTSCDISL